MAKIYKRGRVWYSNFKVHGRKFRKALSTDRRIAENKLADLIKQRDATRHFHAPSDMSWASFSAQYLKQRKTEMKGNTWTGDERALARLARTYPIHKISQMSPDILDQARTKWIAAKRGKYAINRELRSIKTAMYWAERKNLIPKQDWASVKYIKTPKGRLHFFSLEDLKKLKRVCRGSWLTILYLGSRAGLRPAEMWWLEWSDVDFARNRIHIAPKDDWTPKDYERRWVPMPVDLRDYLHQLTTQRTDSRVLSDGGKIPTLNSMTVYFKRLARKAGLKGTPYTLRHTYGSLYTQAGGNIYRLQKYMGHADIETTMIYVHVAPGEADKTLETMPSLV